jgi:archaellum biogenesis ATPase FlaH
LYGGWINAVYENSSNKNSFFKVIYSPDKSWEYRVIIIDRKVNPLIYLFNGKDWEEVKLKNVAVKNMLSGEQKICNELEMMEVEKG